MNPNSFQCILMGSIFRQGDRNKEWTVFLFVLLTVEEE